MKYDECKKIVTRIRFEKAIAVDDSSKSVVNQIDLNSMSLLFYFKQNKYHPIYF
jgi:serine/threonine-protein phosphatase 5